MQQYGLDIKGFKWTGPQSAEIMPYQPAETVTKLQLRTLMLDHVDIKVYKNSITSIRLDGRNMTSGVTLRLSDFCQSVADYVLHGNDDVSNGWNPCTKLTLILDDKLKSLTERSFRIRDGSRSIGSYGMGVVLDISELRNRRLVELVYNAILPQPGNPLWSIIDDNKRKVKNKERWLREVRV